MKAKTWINRIKKLANIPNIDFDDYDKLTKEELEIISVIKADIDNNIGEWNDLKRKSLLLSRYANKVINEGYYGFVKIPKEP